MKVSTAGPVGPNGTEVALAGVKLLRALLLLILGLGSRVLLPRSLVGCQLFRHHFLQLGRSRKAAPHTVLNNDGLDESLIVRVTDEALVHHVPSQELSDQLQLVGGREEAGDARPTARGTRRGRQELKLLPDVLTGCRRLRPVVLLLVEVLIFVEVEEWLYGVIIQVVIPALESGVERHGACFNSGGHQKISR